MDENININELYFIKNNYIDDRNKRYNKRLRYLSINIVDRY